ncbi:MAG: hypothetical protein ACD_24C00118G0004 [uncultured bacterium]|nr:MAG: hypothetical protein ACD_24C00118G0004 [uncultured bacterium]
MLRTLREGIKLSGIVPGRYYKIPRTFFSRLRQHWSFNFYKFFFVQNIPYLSCVLGTKLYYFSHPVAPQIQISIFQTFFLANFITVTVNGNRQFLNFIKYFVFLHFNFHGSCFYIRIYHFLRPQFNHPRQFNYGFLHKIGHLIYSHALNFACPVAQVYKSYFSVISFNIHPALKQNDFSHLFQSFYRHCSS